MSESLKRSCRPWLAWAAISAIYVALRVNLLDIPLGRDEGGFGYFGQVILAGDLPYRDAVDHKPPIAFYLYALALWLLPATPVAIHGFLHVFNFATLLAVAAATRAAFGASAGRWAALCYAVISASPAIEGFTASTEMFMLLPLTLSLVAAQRWIRSPHAGWLLASGALGALACWTKQPAVSAVAWIAAWVALAAWRGDARDRLRRVGAATLAFAGGGLALSLAIIGYFAAHGLGESLYYWAFAHNVLYSASLEVMWARIGERLGALALGDGVVLAAAGFGIFDALRRRRADGIFLAGFLVLSLAGTLPGRAYKHYFCQLLPALSLAAGFGFAALSARPRGAFARGGVVAAAAIAVVAVPVAVHSGYYVSYPRAWTARIQFGWNPVIESEAIADFLRRHADADDRVLIVGSEPQILLLSELRSATPFIYFQSIVRDYPRHVEFQTQAWQEISSRPPEWIVRTDMPKSLTWDGRAERTLLIRINELVRNDYVLRAIASVDEPQGRLYETPDRDTAARATKRVEKAPYRVWVHGRRDGSPRDSRPDVEPADAPFPPTL